MLNNNRFSRSSIPADPFLQHYFFFLTHILLTWIGFPNLVHVMFRRAKLTSTVTNVAIIVRLEHSSLHPLKKHPRQTCPGRESNPRCWRVRYSTKELASQIYTSRGAQAPRQKGLSVTTLLPKWHSVIFDLSNCVGVTKLWRDLTRVFSIDW